MDIIRYGMVGGSLRGFIGDVHRKAIAFDPRARLVAGCFSIDAEDNRETGETFGLDASRVYDDFEAMAEAESRRPDRIDFVCIASPNNTHFDIAKTFLQRGFHVVCEKPLCFTVEEAQTLQKLAREKDLLFAVMYGYSGYTMVKVMREMIAEGKVGDILSVNAEYLQEWLLDTVQDGAQADASVWRADPKVSGNASTVGDIGTHIEHIVRYVTGLRNRRLLATIDRFGRPLESSANIVVEYEGGVKGAYWCSQVAAGECNGLTVRVYGTKGALQWQQESPEVLRYTPKDAPTELLRRGRGHLQASAAHAASRLPSGHTEGFYIAFANVYRAFFNALIKKKAGLPLTEADLDFPNVDDGAEGVRFIQAVIESGDHDAAWVPC